MKYFIDEEFLENGPDQPIYLLSIGIVCEDGREYYGINKDCPLHLASDWVKENVLPQIDITKAIPREQLKEEVLKFINEGHSAPEFWGYYSDYDWVVFCQLFGRMIDLPKGWPMFCLDLRQVIAETEAPKIPAPEGEHNALVDARWNYELYQHLQKWIALQRNKKEDEG